MSLQGKTAIITGAGSGIGREVAITLGAEGVKLLLVDLMQDSLNETVEIVQKNGGEAHAVLADVSKSENVQNYVSVAKDILGSIDLFHNNAGVLQKGSLLHETEETEFDRMVAINLKGAFLGLKYVMAVMQEQGSGSIVNGASHAAIRGEPYLGAYGATKHALVGLTKTAAIEYGGQGIRVNAICPGGVKTNMLKGMETDEEDASPMKRMSTADEIASVVTFLLSDKASYVNGAIMTADGGMAAT